jgi:hypothetical protein
VDGGDTFSSFKGFSLAPQFGYMFSVSFQPFIQTLRRQFQLTSPLHIATTCVLPVLAGYNESCAHNFDYPDSVPKNDQGCSWIAGWTVTGEGRHMGGGRPFTGCVTHGSGLTGACLTLEQEMWTEAGEASALSGQTKCVLLLCSTLVPERRKHPCPSFTRLRSYYACRRL